MIKYIKHKTNMIIKLFKLEKLKKELDSPKEAIHESGVLRGYTCPRCGQKHCIYDFCLACGQRLSYDYAPRSSYIKRFKNVDEMCEILNAIPTTEWDIAMIEQYKKLTGEDYVSLKEKRKMYKIELSDLLSYDNSRAKTL